MEAQLLTDAIAEYLQSLESVAEGLAASPDDAELLELQEQLKAAVQDAEAALAGLQPEAAEEEEQQQQQQRKQLEGLEPAAAGQAVAGPAPAQQFTAGPAPQLATAQPRRAAPGSSNARIHPRSKYAYEEPDFAALAQLYPSLAQFLVCPANGDGSSRAGAAAAAEAAGAEETRAAEAGSAAAAPGGALARASIDFTSPAACRELTRVLLRHDFDIEWWVPLGQLVPPVTNRANYIHWVQDLLGLSAPLGSAIVGLDIGCGANLIYPLLGACLADWHMIGADCTPVALEWAARNLGANPQLAGLIELRAVGMQPEQAAYLQAATAGAAGAAGTAGAAAPAASKNDNAVAAGAAAPGVAAGAVKQPADADAEAEAVAAEALASAPAVASAAPAPVLRLSGGEAAGSGIISAALRKGERVAFCMCNPPFFESLEEAGRNPATAYGGTAPEMVYPGGELAFVSAMVQDSLSLRGAVHWYTTMVGKKSTLRAARSLLYRHGVRVLRTTEFFQGKTSRWALAWSFVADAAAATKPLPRFPAAGAAGGTAAAGRGSSAGAALVAAAAIRPQRKLSWQVHAAAADGPALLDAIHRCLQQAGVQCRVDRAGYSVAGSYAPSPAEQEAASDSAGGPAPKRRRGDGEGGSSKADQDSQKGGVAAAWPVELRLYRQHAGLFLLTAATRAPEGALSWFARLMQRLQAGLGSRWELQA